VGRNDLFIEVVVPRSIGADNLGNGAAPVAGAHDGDLLLGHCARWIALAFRSGYAVSGSDSQLV